MKHRTMQAWLASLAVCLLLSLPSVAEVTGVLGKDLAGTSLTYHYTARIVELERK